MAGKQVNFEVNVDSSDGVRGLRDFSNAAKKAGKDAAKGLEETATAGDKARTAIKAMAQAFDTELRDAAKAAEALGQALGPELASRMDLDQIVSDLGRMGVSFDEVQADADKFATTLREVDDINLARKELVVTADTSQVESGIKRVAAETDKLPASATKARNAQANLWGNAAQDLGQFLGISGSAGVAIGQLAEGAADAANDGERLGSVLKGVGASIGPMLAITAATLLAQKAIQHFSEHNKEAAENIRKATEALQEGIGTFDDWASAVDEAFGAGTANTMEVFGQQVLGMLDSMDPEKALNLQKALGFLGQDVTALGEIVSGGATGFQTWAESQLIAAGASEEHAAAIAGAMGDYGDMLGIVNELEPALAGYATVLHTVGTQLEDIPSAQAAQNFLAVQRSIEGQNTIVAEAVRLATDAATGQVDWNQALLNYIDLQQQATRAARDSVAAAVAYGQKTQENTDRIADYTAGLIPMATSFDNINKAMSEHGRVAGVVAGSWKTLIADIKDGHLATEEARQAWAFLQEQLQLTDEEMTALVDQKVNEQLDADAAAALEFAEAVADLGDTIADINTDDIANIGSALSAEFDKVDDLFSGLKFDVDFQPALDEALGDLRSFKPDLETLAAEWSSILAGQPINIFGNVRADDSEFMEKIGHLRDLFQEGVINAFEQGGVDAANTFVESTAAQIAASTGLDIAEVYRIMGLGPDGSIDAVIRPIVDAESKADALAILDGIIGVDPNNPMLAYLRLQVQTGAIDGVTAEIISLLLAQKYGINVDPQLAEFTPDQIAAAEAQLAATDVTVPVTPTVVGADEADQDLADLTDQERLAEILADPETAAAADELLDFISLPRFAVIKAQAQVAEAEFLLGKGAQGVSRDRIADIVALAHTFDALYALAEAANPGGRPRIAHINVQTHNTSSVGAGASPGGGGPETHAVGPTMTASVTPMATSSTSISSVTQVPFVPAVQPINVTINAGVLGNHFDVERTVARALRRHQRVNGRR